MSEKAQAQQQQQFEQDKEILTRGIELGDEEILELGYNTIPIFTHHAQNPSQTMTRISDLLNSRG